MQRYGQRDVRKPVRLLLRRIGLLALALTVVLASISVWNLFQKERDSAMMRSQNEHELANLTARKKALEQRLSELGTERGKEAILREQYSLASVGEGMITIVDPSEPASNTSFATSSPSTSWLHNLFLWWYSVW